VVRALQIVCVLETPNITNAQKLAFFNETRHAFGRSALLLSGGATLGLYHTGICKALHEQNLLPRVLSGASVGSVICAIMGTRTDEELKHIFDPGQIQLSFFPNNFGSVRRKFTRFFTQGTKHTAARSTAHWHRLLPLMLTLPFSHHVNRRADGH
jgi:TAG lipase / steryl ester hydrolase / phospholipase A2 / LPA acyltransferase